MIFEIELDSNQNNLDNLEIRQELDSGNSLSLDISFHIRGFFRGVTQIFRFLHSKSSRRIQVSTVGGWSVETRLDCESRSLKSFRTASFVRYARVRYSCRIESLNVNCQPAEIELEGKGRGQTGARKVGKQSAAHRGHLRRRLRDSVCCRASRSGYIHFRGRLLGKASVVDVNSRSQPRSDRQAH